MSRPQRYFPWKVAREFFLGHWMFVLVTLLLTGLSLRYFVYTTFLRPGDVHAALSRFDSYLTTLFATVLGGATFYILITTRQYAQPLGRLIQKARELRRFDAPVEEEIVDIEELREEPGEWHDLERALNRIHTELRTQAKALTREREELSTLMEAMSDAILAVDHEGQALFFNSPFALLFNLGESQGHHRASPQQLGLAEMFRVPEILEGYREVIQSGEMRTVRATILTRDEMQPRHFSISIAPLKNWGGESRLS
jgi:PAS domain-containing protein